MHADKNITQTIFAVQFTCGSFPHLGRPLDASSGISPRYLSATIFPLTVLSHYRYNPMGEFEFFLKDHCQWGKAYAYLWGHLDICPSLGQLHVAPMIYPELSSLISLRAWGDVEKSHSNIAYLLVSAKDEVMSDRVYGLSTMWVDPSQARVSTMEEMVRELTALVSSGPNWPYALVWLNKGICHVPLPKEGYLGILTEGGTNSAACRQIGQLEICQLLTSGLQVIYPMGLNRHEVPVIVSPPESLDTGTTLIGGKLTYLKVSILHPTLEGQEPKAPWQSLPHPSAKSCQGSSAKGRKRGQHDDGSEGTSITGSVRHVWTCTSGNSTPKRLNPMVVLTPLPPKTGRSLQSSGHIIPGEHPEMMLRWGKPPWRKSTAAPSPIAKTPGPSSSSPTKGAGDLQKEANKALGELLATKSSIDAHQCRN